MKKLLLIFLVLLSTMIGKAETWTPVGQAKWTEGALTGYGTSYNQTWNVNVERSDDRPQVYRLQPYSNQPLGNRNDNMYVYLHTENPNAIYMEYYIYNCYYYYFHVFQRCPENGFDSRYYGKITGTNTIEFPIGAFAVDEKKSSSKLSFPSSSAYLSTCIHKIVFPEGVLDYVPQEESWVNIGECYWEDPIFVTSGTGEPVAGYTSVEKSVQNPDTYRINPYGGDYIKVYTKNHDKVYISPYTVKSSDNVDVLITQKCAENNYTGSNYGTFTDGKIVIPGNYFIATVQSTGAIIEEGSASRNCIITLPDGFDNPLPEENGVFMGIVAFNEELTRKPISVLNENTKDEFTSFVDGLEMSNATLLYYAVDQAITSMQSQTYPDNLNNAVLVTFTDGLDQGSLAMKPEHRTSRGYASYLADQIANTSIQGHKLEAYAIGLKSEDVYDDELFMYNLQSLASKDENISPVNNVEEMQQKLTDLFENLDKQTSQRIVTIKVPMMSHGDKYRFTLDHSKSDVSASNVWFEGVFNIDNMSLEEISYHGFTSSSGTIVAAKQEGIKLLFTINDCRDLSGNILEVDKDGIDQWQYIPSREIWNHNVENAKAGDIDIQNIKSSVAIMFALDCSTSLGDLFPLVKTTANSFIKRLAGEDSGVENIVVDEPETFDINDPDVEIYNLQGVRVENPTSGIYIFRKGNAVKKMIIR